MDHVIIQGLGLCLDNVWFVPFGVFLGMILGAAPGISSTNSLVILLPFILGFRPETGLILGISVYAGAEMGNSFPAVLLNIPGTPAASVTCFDGYPLMLLGQASKALGICIIASMLGAICGGLTSITAAPLIAKFALKFSAPELCIVILFGICVIGTISPGGVIKGLMAGLFGLLLAVTGTDPMWGQLRGTFGCKYLIDGFPVIPACVGLLAFSELLVLVEKLSDKTPRKAQANVGLQGILMGFWECLKRPVEWGRSSVIGIIVGAIPGAGTSIANFISYQQAKSFASPERRKLFGKGAPEGLIAADAANNAAVGGSLVPLFTLGIPGTASAAVLMAVMGYHGLALGPLLFEMNGDIVYSVLWSQFTAAFFLLIVGVLLSYFSYNVVRVEVGIVVPVVCILCLVGGFATNQYVFDIGIVVVFGFLGYVMNKHGYPPVSLLLGIMLGPLFEANFFRGLKMGFGSPLVFFNRPLAIILWILLILTFSVQPIMKYRSRRKEKG